jgi:hypothetical protein
MLSCFALVAGLTSLTSAVVLGCVLGIGGWVAGVVTVAFTTRFLLSCKRECERRADSEGARLGRSALPGNGTLLRAVRELFRAPTSTREQLGASMSRALGGPTAAGRLRALVFLIGEEPVDAVYSVV